MRITAEYLKKMGASCQQVEVFRKHWPDGARPLARTIQKARRLGLGVDWFTENCLTIPALAEYEKVTATGWAEYLEVTAPALADYWKVTATGWAEYERVRNPALAEFVRVTDAELVRIIRENPDSLKAHE